MGKPKEEYLGKANISNSQDQLCSLAILHNCSFPFSFKTVKECTILKYDLFITENLENTEKPNEKLTFILSLPEWRKLYFGILLLLSIIKLDENWIMLYNFMPFKKIYTLWAFSQANTANSHLISYFLTISTEILIISHLSDWAHVMSHLIGFECFMHGKYINFIYILQSRTSIMPGT